MRNIAIFGKGALRTDLVRHLDRCWKKDGLWHRGPVTLSEGIYPNTHLGLVFCESPSMLNNDLRKLENNGIPSLQIWPDYVLESAPIMRKTTNLYLPDPMFVNWDKFLDNCTQMEREIFVI